RFLCPLVLNFLFCGFFSSFLQSVHFIFKICVPKYIYFGTCLLEIFHRSILTSPPGFSCSDKPTYSLFCFKGNEQLSFVLFVFCVVVPFSSQTVSSGAPLHTLTLNLISFSQKLSFHCLFTCFCRFP